MKKIKERRKIGKWDVNIGEKRDIKKRIVKKIENFTNKKWMPVSIEIAEELKKSWYTIKEWGFPSLVIRIDMAPADGREIIKGKIYEIETRPAGLGLVLSLLENEETENWQRTFEGCDCKGFINRSSIQDDWLASKILNLPYYEQIPEQILKNNKGPYWIRTDLRQGKIIEKLDKISLAPLRLEGLKKDLIELGLAKEIISTETLDWSEPFVIKPLVGSRMDGVEIYHPKKPRGFSTKTRILKRLAEPRKFIVQPFVSPQKEDNGWTIWRVYLIWNWDSQKYKFAGGLWNCRANLRVHGAKDSIMGLLLED